MAMTERQISLVIGAQNGDVKSFEMLFSEFYEKVYGFSRMILKNDRDAEDILQETFITAWQKFGTLKTPETFSVWIQVIARNLCNMQLRRKNIEILLDAEQDITRLDDEESEEMLPSIYSERTDLKERFSEIIDSLSEVQRQTIILYYFNELSIEEISSVMSCSPGTVKSRLFLARNAIKAEIQEDEDKRGERFYGIVGIPLIPLSRLINNHMSTISISSQTASSSFIAVRQSIYQSSVLSVDTPTTERIQNITEEIRMTKKLSLGAKILIVVVSTVTVAAVMVGGYFLVDKVLVNKPKNDDSIALDIDDIITDVDDSNDTPSDDLPDQTETEFDFNRLDGYWVTQDNVFIGFFHGTDGFRFEYGLLRSGYWEGGNITDISNISDNTYAITLIIPAVPADHMDGPSPERTLIINLCVDNIDVNSTIDVKSESNGTGDWYTYTFLGNNLKQREYSVEELFAVLSGYWFSEDDENNPFIGFFTNESGISYTVEYGVYQSWFGFEFDLTGYQMEEDFIAKLTVYFAPVEATDVSSALPERTETVFINMEDYEDLGVILVKIVGQTEGIWATYRYVGADTQEAYANSSMS